MYKSLTIDLTSSLNTSQIITIQHPLWKRLEKHGVKLVPNADEQLKPALFGDQVWAIAYNIRRAFTASGQTDLGGFTLSEAIDAGDEHPFWQEVDLPGVPMLWGAAVIPYYLENDGYRILLGVKALNTDHGVKAIYAGELTPPAGIVDIIDFAKASTIEEALACAGLRELEEETGIPLTYSRNYVERLHIFSDIERCKQQSFIMVKFPNLASVPGGTELELLDLKFYSLKEISEYQLSAEGEQGISLLPSIQEDE
jgi:8-oxo-dGTP pyrophosphatase MutT (NUDIX family)